jgi:uncharacterized protein (TIGR02646 family)
MIPIRRGAEPDSLRNARWWRLGRAALYLHQHGSLKGFNFDGYDVEPVKPLLRERQYQKCAYCEQQRELLGSPVEHIRPKNGAIRAPGRVDPLCYWWLAWTWENLCFSCSMCNENPHKSNHYPLAVGAHHLQQYAPYNTPEDALLIDPSRPHHSPNLPHPMDHIQFIYQDGDWMPTARNGSSYGAATITRLGIAHRDLKDRYNEHMKNHKTSLARIRTAAINNTTLGLLAVWRSELPILLGVPSKTGWCRQPFAALMWDAIDQIVPAPQRTRHSLPFPRPGEQLASDPITIPFVERATQRGFSPITMWHIRALGRSSSAGFDERLREALRIVLGDGAYQPSDAAQLRDLLYEPTLSADFEQASVADIQTALTALQHDGCATHDAADLWSLAPSSP